VDRSKDSRPIWIQLFGEFRIEHRNQELSTVKFRSRTAERLLASLAVRLGGSIHRAELFEALWPESDGDRQAQNLRKALSDIRQVLESDSRSATIVLSQAERLWLNPDQVETDASQFRTLTDAGLAIDARSAQLHQAIDLYSGPLLAEFEEPWVQVQRMELEERFAQSVDRYIVHLLSENRSDEALRVGRQAVVASPYREDVHMALIRAYASAGLPAEAIRQYEEMERILDDEWGSVPSEKSARQFEKLWDGARTVSVSSSFPEERSVPPSGGAVPSGSGFYVARQCDRILQEAIARSEGTILIHGPRQVGKTSLLASVLNGIRTSDTRVVITDFQVLSRSQLDSSDSFAKVLAYGLCTQLGIRLDFNEFWTDWIGPNSNLQAVVEEVLTRTPGPIVWAMDEADRIFGTSFADDFFGLIRSWHNLRALNSASSFGRLSLVVSYATEAHLFIRDINQSPFNVGLRVSVQDFGLREVAELANHYGLTLNDEDLNRLILLTAGQPFLTRMALDAIVNTGTDLNTLERQAAEDDGPFADHLRRLLAVASKDDQTREEVVRFLTTGGFLDSRTPLRLIAGGMLTRTSEGTLRFRVPAYRTYLSRYLTR
jgi:DNA-binding SARP family transcriptional activator